MNRRAYSAVARAGARLAALWLVACGGPAPPPNFPEPVGDDEPTNALYGEDIEQRLVARQPVLVQPVTPGFVLPYPLQRIYGTHGDCRNRGRRQHRGLDIGGIGTNHGLGTPVRSMVRARITMIGRGEDDPATFGRPDTRDGTVTRNRVELPRQGFVPGYGVVHFHSRDYGSWRAGDTVVTVALDPPIAGYRIRYMHLAEPHPELRVGDEVEAGQEIGLMGGTAILQDLPHVHIDMETPQGERVDIAPFLGMEADTRTCRRGRR